MSTRGALLALALVALFPAASSAGTVQVSGTNNVGVGSMSGGSIFIGLTEQSARKLADDAGRRTAEVVVRDLKRERAALEARGDARSDIRVIETFLVTVVGKKVPRQDWPEAFGQLARQWVELGERLGAASSPDSPEQIKRLIRRAQEAWRVGSLGEADALLAQATQVASDTQRRYIAQVQTMQWQLATLLASRANVALTRLEWTQGASMMEEAFAAQPSSPSLAAWGWLISAGEAWQIAGDTRKALRVNGQALQVAFQETSKVPLDYEWRRSLALSHENVGRINQQQGALGAAYNNYRAALSIRLALLQENRNVRALREMSISHESFGQIETARGHLREALLSFQKSADLRADALRVAPTDPVALRDLSIAHSNVGQTLLAMGRLSLAQKQFLAAAQIREKLFASNQASLEAQSDLGMSNGETGEVLAAAGELESAKLNYELAFATAKRITEIDKGNARWQRQLMVAHVKLGDIELVLGNFAGAVKQQRLALSIAESLASRDRTNADAQVDLALCHERNGRAESGNGDAAASLHHYQLTMSIASTAAMRDPENPRHQRDLEIAHNRIGNYFARQKDFDQALEHYAQAARLADRLAESDSDNADWYRDQAIAKMNAADAKRDMGRGVEAASLYREVSTIFRKLALEDDLDVTRQRDLMLVLWKLGALEPNDASADERAAALFESMSMCQSLESRALLSPEYKDVPEQLRRAIDNFKKT